MRFALEAALSGAVCRRRRGGWGGGGAVAGLGRMLNQWPLGLPAPRQQSQELSQGNPRNP